MSFDTHSTSYTVADYVGRLKRKELTVNRDYQRSPEVWPVQARSFLIESILLGYPIPKLYIRESTDLKTRSMRSEIIDGQQRSMAIWHFYDGKFAISKRSELQDAQGCFYDDLDDDLKAKFVSYKLSADVLTGANNDEIIELFRRMNSHTVSLNAEEQRYAQFQGDMKWFVYELSREFGPMMERLGIFGVKQMARMQDAKFYADVIYAIFNGIKTTKKTQLDDLYRQYNSGFNDRDAFKERFANALAYLSALDEFTGTKIFRHYNFYALLLAVMHVQDPIDELVDSAGGDDFVMRDEDDVVRRLWKLSAVLDEDEQPKQNRSFWIAAKEKTNTEDHRSIRFKTFLTAISSR